jgi:signal transduction histidine kinase
MDVGKIARLFVGIVAFFVLLSFFQASKLFVFASEAAAENGKLSASYIPQSATLFEILSSVLGVFVFLFSRLGAGTIAFFKAVFAAQAQPTRQSPEVTPSPVMQIVPAEDETQKRRDQVLDLARAAKLGDRAELVRLANEIHGESFITLSMARARRSS